MKLRKVIPVVLIVLQVMELLSNTDWWKRNFEVVKDKLTTMKYKFQLN